MQSLLVLALSIWCICCNAAPQVGAGTVARIKAQPLSRGRKLNGRFLHITGTSTSVLQYSRITMCGGGNTDGLLQTSTSILSTRHTPPQRKKRPVTEDMGLRESMAQRRPTVIPRYPLSMRLSNGSRRTSRALSTS